MNLICTRHWHLPFWYFYLKFLKKHIHFLEKFCIPAPVIGGLLFAILTCIGYSTGLADFTFDDTLREVCMVFSLLQLDFRQI